MDTGWTLGEFQTRCSLRECTSTAVWNMAGVVSEEKVMVLEVVSSGVKRPMNWLMIEVLAVPGPPTSRDACATTSAYSNFCLLMLSLGLARKTPMATWNNKQRPGGNPKVLIAGCMQGLTGGR